VEGLYPLHQTICLDGFYNVETKYSKKEQLVFWNNVKNQISQLLGELPEYMKKETYGTTIIKNSTKGNDVNITIQPKGYEYFTINVEDYPINVYFDNNKTTVKPLNVSFTFDDNLTMEQKIKRFDFELGLFLFL